MNKLFEFNLKISTSIFNNEAVTLMSSDLILTPSLSTCMNESALPIANLNTPSVSIPALNPPCKSPLLKVEPLPIDISFSALLMVIALLPVPDVNEPALI